MRTAPCSASLLNFLKLLGLHGGGEGGYLQLKMIIGLTGTFGSGKSTVARLFVEAGARLVDSDAIVAELYEQDESLRGAIRERFGNEVFAADASVDRKALGKQVFGDPESLKWLEGELHPRIKTIREERIASDPDAVWILEIPLLFEKSLETGIDYSISVSSNYSLRVSRLHGRGFDPEEVAERSSRQLTQSEKDKRADFIITNDGSLHFLRKQVESLYRRFH